MPKAMNGFYIDKFEVVAHYQPIICNQSKEVMKYEALMRLLDGKKLLYPNYFFKYHITNNKQYNEVSKAMLERVVDDINMDRIGCATLNISMVNINDISYCRSFFNAVATIKDKSRLVIEFLESDDIDYKKCMLFLSELKSMGLRISLDDFGAGYSNFMRMAEIDFDYIKIDGNIIRNIQKNKNLAIVKSVVAYAKEVNTKTIAEYVENEEIYKSVCDLEIDYSQGHYFGKARAL